VCICRHSQWYHLCNILNILRILRRVRNNIAKDFAIVAQAMGFHEASHKSDLSEVLSIFASLLQDYEAQVRASAVENIARMTQLAGVQLFKQYIAPYLRNLADDPVVEVRTKLAQTIMDCCDETICSSMSDEIILEDFKPCLESLLGDEFAEVQLHILSKLSRVTRLLDKMDVVVQSILNMSKASNWRVREAVGSGCRRKDFMCIWNVKTAISHRI
jgi:serine/threonine-protein phosphatase 2A regulatory subunit A